MTEDRIPQMVSRQFVREYLGINEAKLRRLITLGELHPCKDLGSFWFEEVKAREAKSINKLKLEYGNLDKGQADLAVEPGEWQKPQILLRKNGRRSRAA